jgi:tetratricopeptide (TPR) repeat protein
MIDSVCAAMDDGKFDEAIDLLTKAIKADPKNAALMQSRGAVHLMRCVEWPEWKSGGDKQRAASVKRALDDLEKAVKLAPDYAEATLNRGLAHLRRLDRESAEADFTRALALGLEPTFELQAYDRRASAVQNRDYEAAVADIAIVNKLRRRHKGDEWRKQEPQRASLRVQVPMPMAAPPKTPKAAPKKVLDAPPAKVVAAFEALTRKVLAAKTPAALKKLHEKLDELDLLAAADDKKHERAIQKCIAAIRAYRKKLPEKAGQELDDILDTVTDS